MSNVCLCLFYPPWKTHSASHPKNRQASTNQRQAASSASLQCSSDLTLVVHLLGGSFVTLSETTVTDCYRKLENWKFAVDLPMNIVIFHNRLLVYQRVVWLFINQISCWWSAGYSGISWDIYWYIWETNGKILNDTCCKVKSTKNDSTKTKDVINIPGKLSEFAIQNHHTP